MSAFNTLFKAEILLITALVGYVVYFVFTKKNIILSASGRSQVRKNMERVKAAIILSLASIFIYLVAESAEIISSLFPERVNTQGLLNIHAYGEFIHLFIIAGAMLLILSVLLNMEGESNG